MTDIRSNIGIKGTAADANITAFIFSNPSIKSTAVNIQLPCVLATISVQRINGNFVAEIGSRTIKFATVDFCLVCIENDSVTFVGKLSAADFQNTAIVVLDGDLTAFESTAIDGQLRCSIVGSCDIILTFLASVIALIAVFKHTGVGASIGNCHVGIYGHNTMIADGVPAVSMIAIGVFTGTCFCAAGIGTAIENNRTIIEDCSTTVRNVIHSTRSLDSKFATHLNIDGIFTGFIHQRFPVQIKGNSFACRNSDACSYIITQRYFAIGSNGSLQIFSSCYFCRHRHDGQHYSHHKQGQRYAYYFFHVNLSFVFCFFARRGVRVCVQTRGSPMGLRTHPF